jgi:hypothetical protein
MNPLLPIYHPHGANSNSSNQNNTDNSNNILSGAHLLMNSSFIHNLNARNIRLPLRDIMNDNINNSVGIHLPLIVSEGEDDGNNAERPARQMINMGSGN